MNQPQKVAKVQLIQRSTLTPAQFEELLKSLQISNRHVYEGAELQLIEAAISRQRSQSPPETDPSAANNALTQVAQAVVGGISAQLQQFSAGLTDIKEQASDYMSDELAALPRDIAALTVVKTTEKMQANPVGLGAAMEAAFRSLRLPPVSQPAIPTLSAGSDKA